MIDIDKIRKNSKLARTGFYHVVGAHYCVREAEFDALVEEVERLREEAVVARSNETWLTVENEQMRAQVADCAQGYRFAAAKAKARERAAVVAWLRGEPERLVECDGHRHADGKPCMVMSPMPADELADAIERGEHRREEKP
jgi:hypothetical protein